MRGVTQNWYDELTLRIKCGLLAGWAVCSVWCAGGPAGTSRGVVTGRPPIVHHQYYASVVRAICQITSVCNFMQVITTVKLQIQCYGVHWAPIQWAVCGVWVQISKRTTTQ